MMALDWLEAGVRGGKLDMLDVVLARQLHRLGGDPEGHLPWLTALLSYQLRQGHVCLDLQSPPSVPFDANDCPWQVPRLDRVTAISCPAIGDTDSDAPLVLDGTRLYFRRHYLAECRVSDALRARLGPIGFSAAQAAELAQKFFPAETDPWQRVAAVNGALHRFAVITGGPGTGKTWTVTRMLALQLGLAVAAKNPLPRIALAAPTGKAAARLTEALREALPGLPLSDALRDALPVEAVTLHRLLAMGRHGKPRFNSRNPLPYDIVVVDEASMIDLGLMAQLVDALPPHAALYLVGDRDQLASVQAGSVFADVCGMAENRFDRDRAIRLQEAGVTTVEPDERATFYEGAVVRLVTVHRFASDSAMARLADAVRMQKPDVIAKLQGNAAEDLEWLPAQPDAVLERMQHHYFPLVEAALAGMPAEKLLHKSAQFRTLAAMRHGELGVEPLNLALEQRLRQRFGLGAEPWYPGRLVLLRQNDWNLRLFNGEIGIAVKDPASGQIRIAFAAASEGVRLVAPARLPEFEPAWAMTVHKSQGSEFEQVLLVLPSQDSPVLTRELLYTGVTRARRSLTLAVAQAQLVACLERPVWRAAGLHDRLRCAG